MRISDWSSDVCSSDLVVQKPEGISSLPFLVAERRPIAADAGKTGLCGRELSGDADPGLDFTLRERPTDTRRQRSLPDVAARREEAAAVDGHQPGGARQGARDRRTTGLKAGAQEDEGDTGAVRRRRSTPPIF